MLKITDVRKTYEDEHGRTTNALESASLDVSEGGFVSIVGPSGCGKSTLLEIVAGLLTADSGTIEIDGDVVTEPHPVVGVVFQEDSLFPWLSVQGNVEFGRRAKGDGKSEAHERAAEMVKLVGLERFSDHYPEQLSGGMRQRVAIARTLVTQPKVILMDEPFGALDEQTRLVLGEEVLRLWDETGSTIVFVTHSLSEAAMLSDRIAVMTARPGTISEVIDVSLPRPRNSDIIGTPEFTQITGRLWSHLHGQAQEILSVRDERGAEPAATGRSS